MHLTRLGVFKVKNKKKYVLSSLVLSFLMLTFSPDKLSANQPNFRKLYFFQHKLLPRWTHRSRGKFFKALMNQDYRVFNRVANKYLGEEYTSKIKFKKYENLNGVLITFPTPFKSPLCYYVFIMKKGEGNYKYYTYEKTMGFTKGAVGAYCCWTASGRHRTFGIKKYKDAESFIAEFSK